MATWTTVHVRAGRGRRWTPSLGRGGAAGLGQSGAAGLGQSGAAGLGQGGAAGLGRQSRRPLRRRGAALAAALLAAALCAAAGAAPAAAGIRDSSAEPSHAYVIHGDAPFGSDYANDVVVANGFTYVAGEADYADSGLDATLTRISHSTWTARTWRYDARNRDEAAKAIALGPDGSVYTAGVWSNGSDRDMLVVRWSRSGSILWARRYDGPASAYDEALDIAVDTDGNVIVCGPSTSEHGYDWAVVSWNKRGQRRWVWRRDGTYHFTDVPAELLIDKAGRTYVCGELWVKGPKTAAGVAKLSKTGAKLWTRTYTGPIVAGASARALTADPRGGVIIAGTTVGEGTGRDAMIVRYSPSGARTLYRLLSVAEDEGIEAFRSVCVTKGARRIVAAGFREDPGGTTDPIWAEYGLDEWDYSLHLLSPTDPADVWGHVVADPFGGFVLTGSTAVSATGTAFTTWRDSTLPGAMVWYYRWTGPLQPRIEVGRAAAVRGGVVASVGYQWSADPRGWDQVVLIWVY